MENLYDRLTDQLDTLVAFLALAHEEVFDVAKEHYEDWVPTEHQEQVPGTYVLYRTQIANSAFLLGYSYFEAFLADIIRQTYTSRPRMLPKEKQLTFVDVLDAGSYDALVKRMIDREVVSVLYNSMEKVEEYFGSKLNLKWPPSDRLVAASRLRNCIVHNMSRADRRLAEVSDWDDGQVIQLTPSDVHDFGIAARTFARLLYEDARTRLEKQEDV